MRAARIVMVVALISFISATIMPLAKANSPPILKEKVSYPRTGDTTTTYYFSVIYMDPDNDPPEYVKLIISDVELVPYSEKNKSYPNVLTIRNPFFDAHWNVIGYKYEFAVSNLPIGNYMHYFVASDGIHIVEYRYHENTNFAGPTVSKAPQIDSPNFILIEKSTSLFLLAITIIALFAWPIAMATSIKIKTRQKTPVIHWKKLRKEAYKKYKNDPELLEIALQNLWWKEVREKCYLLADQGYLSIRKDEEGEELVYPTDKPLPVKRGLFAKIKDIFKRL